MLSTVSVSTFVQAYYEEVELQEVLQDVSTLSVIYQDGEKTRMDLWTIRTDIRGRAYLDLEVTCAKCMDICECKLQSHYDEGIKEDMKPLVLTEPRLSYNLDLRETLSEYIEGKLCTCEYDEKHSEPNSFYQNHGSCMTCFFL